MGSNNRVWEMFLKSSTGGVCNSNEVAHLVVCILTISHLQISILVVCILTISHLQIQICWFDRDYGLIS